MDFSILDAKIRQYCQENLISGSLRLTVKDQVLYQANFGYAEDETKTEFDKNSLFTFYSMSKPLCAVGLMKLKDKGLIDIDLHPSKYLPEAEKFNKNVTIRHMLHHVSGIPDFEREEEFCRKHAPGYSQFAREHVKLLSEIPSYFEPNTNALYASINYEIPALIIENVSGKSYADYMKTEVFEPLGMKNAMIDSPELDIKRVQGYGLENGKRVRVNKAFEWLMGGGDVVGTIDDVYCLNTAYKHKKLLSEKTWQEIVTPSPLNNMGLGNTILNWHGKLRINHNGGHYGFRTLHLQLPKDDFDLILMCNSGFGSPREDISEMIYDFYYGTDDVVSDKLEMDKGFVK